MKIRAILSNKFGSTLITVVFLIGALAGCAGVEDTAVEPTDPNDPDKVTGPTRCLQDYADLVSENQLELALAIRGGRIYDNWWVETGTAEPTTDHPLWDTRTQSAINTNTGSATWRCKECHGWDYKGVDGVYGSTNSSHYTGFPGVMSAQSKQPIDVFCAIHSGTNIDADHNFSSQLSPTSILHLTKFLVSTNIDGLIDSDPLISSSGASTGNPTNGQTLYNSANGCSASNCHGVDGATQHEPLGELSIDNPWEVLHKIRFGHPGLNIMPAYAESNYIGKMNQTQMADVIAYTQTFDAGGGGTTPPPPASEAEIITRGGRLFDNWIAETGVTAPPINNPVWALQATNTRTGADTWRCKECHGWDYKGVDGVYGDTSNSHYTGFGGVFGTEKTEIEIVEYLTNGFRYGPTGEILHRFDGLIQTVDMEALAKFIKQGTIDVSIYFGMDGIINGSQQDFDNGADLYSFKGFGVVNGNCEACHGAGGIDEPGVIVGLVANENPWEMLHKVRFGQPGTAMPGLFDAVNILTGELAFDAQDAVDIVHYSQSLPQQ
jgi:mono/diheme cytochrome c family protein